MKKTIKYLALVLSFVMLLSCAAGTTMAVIFTQTGSILNTFLSGIEPTGTLVLQKTIRHPFGPEYAIPDNEHTQFGFTVDLGEEHAHDTFGYFTADAEGRFDVFVKANSSISIPDVPVGTQAVITEHTPGPGFTAPDAQTVDISRGENRLNVKNLYDPLEVPGVDLTLRGRKTLEGRDWQEGDSFVFALEVKENDAWVELGQQTVEYVLLEQPDPNDPEKTILLPPADFDRFDFTEMIRSYPLGKPGIYSFRVIEKEGTIPGITYDKMESRLDLLIGDSDMDGWLELQSVDSPSDNTDIDGLDVFIEFENEYAPLGSDDVTIGITKTLVDTSGQNKAPSGFVFELYDEDGELVQISQPTDASGKTEIRLIYETKDAGRTFRYTLAECDEGDQGMTYDDTVYRICVDVIENFNGSVTALVREDAEETEDMPDPEETEPEETEPEEAEPDETEQEKTETEDEPIVQQDAAAPSEPEISEPEQTEVASTEPEQTKPASTEPEQAESAAVEPEPSESVSDEPTPEPPAEDTMDQTETLPTEPEAEEEILELAFTNIYEPKPATLPISGEKNLEGRDLAEDEFTFLLYQTEAGFQVTESMNPVGKATNNDDGEFSFGDLTFYEAGWHYYVVTEDDSDPLGGVTYDDSQFHLRIFVEDNGGRLSVQQASVENAAGEEADISFNNSYAPARAIFTLNGRKTLEGRELEAGEFTFHLYEATYPTSYGFEKGDLLARTTNQADENGNVNTFTFRIEYPEPGTFHYIVTEKAGTEEGMTYDSTEYGIEIVVEDDLAGHLRARVTKILLVEDENTDVQEILFRNIYTEPEDTEPDETDPTETTAPDETTEPDKPTDPPKPSGGKLPQTGQLWWPVPVLLLAGIMLVLIGLFRRRGIRYEKT